MIRPFNNPPVSSVRIDYLLKPSVGWPLEPSRKWKKTRRSLPKYDSILQHFQKFRISKQFTMEEVIVADLDIDQVQLGNLRKTYLMFRP